MQRSDKRVERFYKSKEWKQARRAYILMRGGLCERCKAKGIINTGTHVHHKEYITIDNIDDPNITLNPDNLELLCFGCHQEEHFPREDDYSFDKNGDMIPPV